MAAPIFVGGLGGDALGDVAVVLRPVGEADRNDLGRVGVEIDFVLVVFEICEEDDADVVVGCAEKMREGACSNGGEEKER